MPPMARSRPVAPRSLHPALVTAFYVCGMAFFGALGVVTVIDFFHSGTAWGIAALLVVIGVGWFVVRQGLHGMRMAWSRQTAPRP